MTTTARSEDARTFYQERLALMNRVGFLLSGAFLVGVVGARGLIAGAALDELRSPQRLCHVAATATLAGFWWLLRTKRLRDEVLQAIDTTVALGVTLLLIMNAGLFPVRTVSVFDLILTVGIVAVVRAVIVPSTARRTLALGIAAFAMAVAVFFASAFHPAWPVHQIFQDDWPLSSQLVGLVLWLGALIAIATVASRVIYNLRREVRAARKLGQYVVGEKLGEGGMGIVYRARHAMLRRETALKLLPPDRIDAASLRRFEREVVETARLRHPNTVAIYDYGRTPEGVFYYAMELLDGVTLAELVAQEGPLPVGRVVSLLAQVCASLDEAHSIGLVHRDIKPANVMVVGHTAAYDLAKVLDFGLVKNVAVPPGASMTQGEPLAGTPLYMAPEQISHPDRIEARTDLYSVAAVGYFLVTGKNVFEGESVVEICSAHLHAVPPSIKERCGREVAADLEALLMRGLAKSPDDRPASASAFREALLACDVAPWTPADARAWWTMRDLRVAKKPAAKVDLAHAPTVSVVMADRP